MAKTFAAFLRRADEGALSRLMVETTIMLAASRMNPAIVLRDAAAAYKVNTDAIALKVKQEFAAKDKAKKSPQATPKAAKKAARRTRLSRGGAGAAPLLRSEIAQEDTASVSPCHPHPA